MPRLIGQSEQFSVWLSLNPHWPAILANDHHYLYLTAEHLLTQTDKTILAFYLVKKGKINPAASFFCVEDTSNHWISPPRAPFGGIQCTKWITEEELNFLLSCLVGELHTRKGQTLTIKTAPSCYHPDLEQLFSICYQNAGFEVIQWQTNHSISVCTLPFSKKLVPAARRKLRQAREAGFQAYLDPDLKPDQAYEFLAQCRAQNGYPLSVSAEQLMQLCTRFPAHFLFFGVKDKLRLIALSVAVRVSPLVLYYYLTADLAEYRPFSPAIMLLESLYSFCQQENMTTLDLGISLDHYGNEKPGLIRFKENVGGQESKKRTYRKQL